MAFVNSIKYFPIFLNIVGNLSTHHLISPRKSLFLMACIWLVLWSRCTTYQPHKCRNYWMDNPIIIIRINLTHVFNLSFLKFNLQSPFLSRTTSILELLKGYWYFQQDSQNINPKSIEYLRQVANIVLFDIFAWAFECVQLFWSILSSRHMSALEFTWDWSKMKLL